MWFRCVSCNARGQHRSRETVCKLPAVIIANIGRVVTIGGHLIKLHGKLGHKPEITLASHAMYDCVVSMYSVFILTYCSFVSLLVRSARRFKLMAAVEHISDTPESGHYVAAVCSTRDGGARGGWYSADDRRIACLQTPSLGFFSSLIVVYERCDRELRTPSVVLPPSTLSPASTISAMSIERTTNITQPPSQHPLPLAATSSVLGKRKQVSADDQPYIRSEWCLEPANISKALATFCCQKGCQHKTSVQVIWCIIICSVSFLHCFVICVLCI